MTLALWATAGAVVFLGCTVRAAAGQLVSTLEGHTQMSKEAIARLTTEVSEFKTVAGSAVALIGSLSQQIRDNAKDPAALNVLADELDAGSNALAAAVQANTPAPVIKGPGDEVQQA